MPSILTLLPFEGQPTPKEVSSVDGALAMIATHLQKKSSVAHKERVDLDALQKHSGQRFAQHVLIPDELHASLRALHGVTPLVLLPPSSASGKSVAGSDAVVLFGDTHGALKGLPPNKVVTFLLNACGLSARGPMCGDCFFARLRPDGANGLALGGEAPPQMVSERDWLEAAQAAHKASDAPGAAVEGLLTARFAEARRNELAAAVGQAAAAPPVQQLADVAISSQPSNGQMPSPPPPPPPAGDGEAAAGGAATEASMAAAAGHAADRLTWVDGDKASGTEQTVTVSIRIPAGTKAKHVKATFKEEWLKVEVTTLEGAARVPIDAKPFQPLSPNDCTWCVEDGPASAGGERVLTITLEKKIAMRWIMLTRND